MAFYSREELDKLGFKSLGQNVSISNKASIYGPAQISVGNNSRIDDFCVISGKVTIGDFVHVAVFCNLAGGEAGISMEDFSGLAYGVQIFAQSDDYSGKTLTNPTVPDKYKCEIKRPVILKRHAIIGAGSIIFPGVTINEGCSVGAMSMVTKDTEPWKVYIGIPARPVRDRCKNLLELERQLLGEMNQNKSNQISK